MLDKLLQTAAITLLLSVLMHEGMFTTQRPFHIQPLPQAALPLERR